MVVRRAPILPTLTLVCLQGQACDGEKSVLTTRLDQVFIPQFKRAAPLMVHINEEHRVVVGCVQTFAAEFANSGAFDGKDVSDFQAGAALAHISPQGERDRAAGVVDERHVFSHFLLPAPEIDGLFIADLDNDTRDVERVHLDDLLDVTDVCEVESLLSDRTVVVYLLNLGIFLKDDAEVVLD